MKRDVEAELVESDVPPRGKGRRKVLLLGVIPIGMAAATYFGLDVGGWLSGIVNDVREIPPRFIALAVALKAIESILAAIAWLNILRAAYPEEKISFRFVFGAYQGGVGVNAVTPANVGTFMMLGLYRLLIPGASAAAVLSAAVVQNLVFAVIAVLTWVALILTSPFAIDTLVDAYHGVTAFLDAHPVLLRAAGVALLVLVIVGLVWLRRRVKEFWAQAARGGAILRTPRRFLTHVALPQVLSYACRWGVTMTFLAAFGIPVTAHSTFLSIASNTLANAVQIAPGGIGTTEAILVIALRDYASSSTVTAFSLSMTTILTTWNLLFGLIALVVAFGISGAREIIRQRGRLVADVQGAEATD